MEGWVTFQHTVEPRYSGHYQTDNLTNDVETPPGGPKCLILYKTDLVNQTTSLIKTPFGDRSGGLISEVPL